MLDPQMISALLDAKHNINNLDDRKMLVSESVDCGLRIILMDCLARTWLGPPGEHASPYRDVPEDAECRCSASYVFFFVLLALLYLIRLINSIQRPLAPALDVRLEQIRLAERRRLL